MITEERSVCFGNCPLEILKLRSIGCTSLQVKENLTMVVYKSLSSVTRNPEEASPRLALSGVTGVQVCSAFLLIHSERVCKTAPASPGLTSAFWAKAGRKEGREKLAAPVPSARNAEVPPGGPVAASGSLGSRGAGLSEINAAYCLGMHTLTSEVNQGSLREETGKSDHGAVLSSVCCIWCQG